MQLSNKKLHNLVWVYGGGTHYLSFLFQNYLLLIFLKYFGMVSSRLVGINLASLILPYLIIFDILLIYRKYYWVIFHRSIFGFYYMFHELFSILLSVSSALSPDIF